MTTAAEGPHVRCPSCGVDLNFHHCTTTPGATPKPGDLMLCWRCASPAVFVASPAGLALRVPDDTEMATIKCDPNVASALNTLRAAREATRGRAR